MSIYIRPSSTDYCNMHIRDMKCVALSSLSSRLVSILGLYPNLKGVVSLVGKIKLYSVKMHFSTFFKAYCIYLLELKFHALAILLSFTAFICHPR